MPISSSHSFPDWHPTQATSQRPVTEVGTPAMTAGPPLLPTSCWALPVSPLPSLPLGWGPPHCHWSHIPFRTLSEQALPGQACEYIRHVHKPSTSVNSNINGARAAVPAELPGMLYAWNLECPDRANKCWIGPTQHFPPRMVFQDDTMKEIPE